MRQFQCVPTAYGTEIKENYLEIYPFQVSCPLSLHLLELLNCQSVLKYMLRYCKLFVQEVFHVYLNKFENTVTHLFLVMLGNN